MTRSLSWLYQKNGHELGPVAPADLRRLVDAGDLSPDDLVRPESRDEWVRASKVRGLFPDDLDLELDPPLKAETRTGTEAGLPPLPDGSDHPAANQAIPAAITPANEYPAQGDTVTVELSPSAESLRQVVAEVVWGRLMELQLPVNDVFFWSRLSAIRIRRKQEPAEEASGKGLWERASKKIAAIAESADIPTNRFLIASSDGRYWVTNQLAAASEVWQLDETLYDIRSRYDATQLTVEFKTHAAEPEVEMAQFTLGFAPPFSTRCFGSPNRILAGADGTSLDRPVEEWLPFPLVRREHISRSNSFFHPSHTDPSVCSVAMNERTIVTADGNQRQTVCLDTILAWRFDEHTVTWIADRGGKIELVTLATDAAVPVVDDATEFIQQLNLAEAAQTDAQIEASEAESSEPEPNKPRDAFGDDVATEAHSADDANGLSVEDHGNGHPSRLGTKALNAVAQALKQHCRTQQCESQMLVAEFTATPLFRTAPGRLVIVSRDSEIRFCVSGCNDAGWQILRSPRLHSLAGRWFLQADNATFEISVDESNERIISALAMSLPSAAPGIDDRVCLVLLSQQLDETENANSATPFRLHFQGEGRLRFETTDEDGASKSFECDCSGVDKRSQSWNEQFGSAVLTKSANGDESLILIAPRQTLIQIWETRELTQLKSRTRGITLGEMYAEYNEMRINKFLTGVFGDYFLAQQRLEQETSLDEFLERIESAPSGVLPEELEMKLIERLSILEISRSQLSRWLDRCTLMYPHQQAELTCRWLDEAFGRDVVSEETRDEEAWRVQCQVRGELRQVQASMNRAMAEVGQNLNAISFAFPEEVRCAALAATRRAASMAGKGAMVAAFAGMGGQMLMGLGRASIGDPMGIGLLGTVGMSMVGRHLEKNAKETEKKIRIRAYGVQALQWWKVVLETAAVMALECRQTIERTQKAAMKRDRELLESMPREQLSQTQKRMAAVMRTMLREELGSQFYEALPGSGVFGWHIVDHVSEMTQSAPRVVLKNFSVEVPGSLAKRSER